MASAPSPPPTKDRTRILCVDDEPEILNGLGLLLRRRFQVVTAEGAAAGLAKIASEAPFAVVISDMRMPGMDGATFLSRVREVSPATVRMLLTGHSDMESAIVAVNQGQIFRFLSKPCPPALLVDATMQAVEQHRLLTAERVLLEETLHGAVRALTDVLALVNPAAFGRALRVKEHVARLAAELRIADRWQVEVAAMLSQVGCVTLPPATLDRLYAGEMLTPEELEMVERMPGCVDRLIGQIPRLEPVREILAHATRRFDSAALGWGGRALRIALDFDVLDARGLETAGALDIMRGRSGIYDPSLLQAFGASLNASRPATAIRELRLRDLAEGMVLAEDVRSRTGTLLVARGQPVSASLLERIRNFAPMVGVREPIRAVVPAQRIQTTGGANA